MTKTTVSYHPVLQISEMYYYIGKIIFYNPQDIFFKPFYRTRQWDRL